MPEPPARRTPLTRDRVIRAALETADAGGLEKLSMRKLGQQLGFEGMALYNHVANKDDIIDGIVELAWSEIDLVPFGAPWRDAVRKTVIAGHEMLMRHPWACDVFTTRVSLARMSFLNSMLGHLRLAPFSEDITYDAFHSLEAHLLGFTVQMIDVKVDSDDFSQKAGAFLATLPKDEFHFLLEHVDQHVEEATSGRPSRFDFGVDIILERLTQIHEGL